MSRGLGDVYKRQLVAQLRTRKARRLQPAAMGAAFAGLPDDDIIEL